MKSVNHTYIIQASSYSSLRSCPSQAKKVGTFLIHQHWYYESVLNVTAISRALDKSDYDNTLASKWCISCLSSVRPRVDSTESRLRQVLCVYSRVQMIYMTLGDVEKLRCRTRGVCRFIRHVLSEGLGSHLRDLVLLIRVHLTFLQ